MFDDRRSFFLVYIIDDWGSIESYVTLEWRIAQNCQNFAWITEMSRIQIQKKSSSEK